LHAGGGHTAAVDNMRTIAGAEDEREILRFDADVPSGAGQAVGGGESTGTPDYQPPFTTLGTVHRQPRHHRRHGIYLLLPLADPTDLRAVEALGVRMKDRYRGMEVIIADVPVDSLSALASIDNVTLIDVSRLMQPMTDIARDLTHVEDLLTLSQTARDAGLSNKYDGTGVVLGIVDDGIDFRHIAFKDKDGRSRIKRASTQ